MVVLTVTILTFVSNDQSVRQMMFDSVRKRKISERDHSSYADKAYFIFA